MNRKLLVMDLDGTVLDSDGALHEASIRALNALRQQGHVVAYATGRREYDMENYTYLYDSADYAVMNTGSFIDEMATGSRLYEQNVAPQVARELIDTCLDRGWQLYVITAERYHINIMTDGVEEYILRTGIQPGRYSAADDFDLNAVEGFMTARDSDPILAYIEERGLPLNYICSEPGCYDVVARGVSKWNGIRRLARLLDIPDGDIIAMGNWLNDMEMVVNAGVGVAVQDAVQDLKDVADYVTPHGHNEDPILDVCRHCFGMDV